MTPERILQIAYGFEQYPGAKEPTLRGQAIVEFARALMAETQVDEDKLAALGWQKMVCPVCGEMAQAAPTPGLKNGPHYSPPGTTSSAAAPKESAS